MNENGYPKRRNLDGIYFRVERDGKWQNICFTDLTADERTAMPELIDKGELKTAICIACSNGVIEIEGCASDDCTLQRLIDDLPTIEAEPVIHCKDCAFWESKRVSCEGLARCRTGESGYRYRFGHDFCSRAQRQEEVSEDAES